MTLARRIGKIVTALFTASMALLLYAEGEEGLPLVGLILSVSLIAFGLRSLIFYFTMARHMVDGRNTLYVGVIALDLGVFTLSISDNQTLLISLYLLASYAFSGGMDILRALEARRFEAPSWRLNLLTGIVNIAFAAVALFFGLFRGGVTELVDIYAAGLVFSACTQLVSAFRKTAIVYIQ